MQLPNMLDGFALIPVPTMVTLERRQYRWPVSKRKRIRRKFQKRAANFRTVEVPMETCIADLFGKTIYAHPKKVAELRKTLVCPKYEPYFEVFPNQIITDESKKDYNL